MLQASTSENLRQILKLIPKMNNTGEINPIELDLVMMKIKDCAGDIMHGF